MGRQRGRRVWLSIARLSEAQAYYCLLNSNGLDNAEEVLVDMHSPDIAVLIPCYNEALTIAKVVDDFKEELPEASIYVYDNNSSDGTGDIARSHGAIVRLEPRQGKGNVVRQMLRDIEAE